MKHECESNIEVCEFCESSEKPGWLTMAPIVFKGVELSGRYHLCPRCKGSGKEAVCSECMRRTKYPTWKCKVDDT